MEDDEEDLRLVSLLSTEDILLFISPEPSAEQLHWMFSNADHPMSPPFGPVHTKPWQTSEEPAGAGGNKPYRSPPVT